VPQAPIQQAPAVVPVAIVRPRRGNITQVNNNQVPWVGGGGTLATTLNNPASSLALRPNDLSLALKVEKACIQGLPEARRLPVPGIVDTQSASTSVKFADWIYMMKNALVERGLDSVFRAEIDGVEVFLLDKWGKATKANIDAHVEDLRLHGDEYDCKNLQLLAKFILNLLDDEMLRRTERELGNATANETTGPDVYAAVIALHSVLRLVLNERKFHAPNHAPRNFRVNLLTWHNFPSDMLRHI
jgi:hypothetical protein